MTPGPDRRRWPSNKRVAARRLEGQHSADQFVDPMALSVVVPVADLLDAPDGRRDRQVLFGETLDVLEDRDGFAFVETQKDGYTGYVARSALGDVPAATHSVSAAATHVYRDPDFKKPELFMLSLGARVCVTGGEGRFATIPQGFVPARHLRPLDVLETDPVAVSERLIGTPYLWGGNSRSGIDCSGLIQAGCIACGIICPGDSDMQADEVGQAFGDNEPLQRGDLVFWKGHVAWVVDHDRILHANAHDMCVAYEAIDAAIERIERQGDGPVTGRRRIG